VPDGAHAAVVAEHGIEVEALAGCRRAPFLARDAPARGLVEVQDHPAAMVERLAPVFEQALERLGRDAALLHARAGVGGERAGHGGSMGRLVAQGVSLAGA